MSGGRLKPFLKVWIHQEIEFDSQKELDDYKAKNPYIQIIETKGSDGKRVIAVVKKPYNNSPME